MAPAVLPITVERFQADLNDSDRATAQTVERMAQHIKDGAADPGVVRAAHHCLKTFAGGRPDRRDGAWGAFWGVKHSVKFVQDEGLFNRPIKLRDGRTAYAAGLGELEILVSPAFMCAMREPRGDCDDFTMLVCAFLRVLGCPYQIITVAADPNEPGRYSHVYAVAILEDGSRLPLDTSHGAFPGWEVPAQHMTRYQAWGEDGRPAAGERALQSPLHGYTRKRRGMRGLGDPGYDDYGNLITGGSSSVDLSKLYPISFPGGSSGGGGSSFDWGKVLGTTIGSGMQILGRVVAPTTMITGPNGYSVTTPGALPGGSNLLSAGSSFGSFSTTTLLIGGVVLLIGLKAMSK